MDLLTSDDIENYLGVTFTPEQSDRAEMLVELAIGEIESYLGRVVEQTVFTEYVDIDSEGKIFVSNTPVIDVESLVIDGQEISSEDWQPTKWGINYLIYSAFRYYPEVAIVTYTAGLPDRAVRAINSLILFGVIRKMQASTEIGDGNAATLKRVRVEDYEYEYDSIASSDAKLYAAKAGTLAIFPSDKDFISIKRYKKVRSA